MSTIEQHQTQLKYERIQNALAQADRSLIDAFHAFQEASTEVENREARIKLERLRNSTRVAWQKIPPLAEKIESEFNPN